MLWEHEAFQGGGKTSKVPSRGGKKDGKTKVRGTTPTHPTGRN